MKKAIVVGAGVAGLASSIRLAIKGYQVQVFEQNSYPGGKLATFSLQGYRFDAGPSLFTMPHFVTELFELAGESAAEHFEFSKKEVACTYFWQDGTEFTAYSDRKQFIKQAHQTFGEPEENIERYFNRAKKKYEFTSTLFLEKSLHKLKTFLSLDTVKALFQLRTFELQKTLHQANVDAFSSTHFIQLLDRYATYNGSDPYQTSGMMTLIQHLESAYGTFVPKKGMVSITDALFGLAKRLGVQFHFETSVEEIRVKSRQAKGVKTKTASYEADFVVSNMDVFHTYKKLLPKEKPPQKRLKQERSSSAVIFYWGIARQFEKLDLHNIFFSEAYQKEFQAIFKEQTVAEDPTIYVNITSKDVPEDAPEGCENWFVMVNTPAQHGQDWEQLVDRLRTIVIRKLSERLGVALQQWIVCEEVLTPPRIESKTQSYRGALYGASSNDAMAAFLRHPNFSSRIKNLYFCGGSVHPGGGIPLCLLSAKIVGDLIPKV